MQPLAGCPPLPLQTLAPVLVSPLHPGSAVSPWGLPVSPGQHTWGQVQRGWDGAT